jgi:hypothetical protein
MLYEEGSSRQSVSACVIERVHEVPSGWKLGAVLGFLATSRRRIFIYTSIEEPLTGRSHSTGLVVGWRSTSDVIVRVGLEGLDVCSLTA